MIISDCCTQHLFLLIGGNTLPNYVTAVLLAPKDTKLYLIYSKGTNEQRSALSKTLNPDGQPARYQIAEIPVEESNPTNIYSEMSKQLKLIPESASVGLHYTGGTKAMAVHAYRALQDWQKGKKGYACYTYLDARTLHLWAERSDWRGAQALFVGDMLDVSLSELLMLHRRAALQKPVRPEAIWPSVARGLAHIYSNDNLREKWVAFWQKYKKQAQAEKKSLKSVLQDLSTDELLSEALLNEYVYEPLQKEIGYVFPITWDELIAISPFAKSRQAYDDFVGWLTGFWLEDHVFLQLQQLASQYFLHDLALNIKPKLGNADFEFDVVAMRWYQLFAFSCTVSRDRKECKRKLLEAVARARQLGGSEARIALVCCYDDADDLQNEVEALVSDIQLRVFGRYDLLDLHKKIEQWLKDLDLITSKP
jgi:hypothetical protein